MSKILRIEDQSRNGVRVIKRVHENGTTVEADCQRFGHPFRVHSTLSCPRLRCS